MERHGKPRAAERVRAIVLGATVVAGVKGKMAAGTYTVAWRTMAKDGHVARGTFAFTVAPAKR